MPQHGTCSAFFARGIAQAKHGVELFCEEKFHAANALKVP